MLMNRKMPSEILDNFEDLSGWAAVTSGETQLTRSSADGPVGKPMRLHFDFCAGGGFVVARRDLPPELPRPIVRVEIAGRERGGFRCAEL